MKAVVGTALIAGAIALTVASGGIGAIAAIGASGAIGALFAGVVVTAAMTGAELDMASIADALTNTPTTPVTIRSPAAPWHAVYGNIRTGGTVIDCNSYGDNFKYCDQIICLACHPIDSVVQHTEVIPGDATFPSFGGLYINGQGMQFRNNAQGGSGIPASIGYDINGIPFGYTSSNDIQDLNQNHYSTGTHVYMEAYYGDGKSYQAGHGQIDNQISQFYIDQGPSGHWNSNCGMMIDVGTSAYTGGTVSGPIYANEQGVPKGISYVYLRLLYASNLWAGGMPQSFRFDIRGKNDIWDPRLSGGTGGYAFTSNAALIIADFLTNQYFGMGYRMADINQAQLIAAANICDTEIPLAAGGTVAEYTINGTFDTSQNPATTLKAMLQACDGQLTCVGGVWFIFPGAYVFPTATITPSMLAGPMNVSVNQKPRDLFNAVKGTFICPAAVDTFGSPNIFLNEQPNIFNGQWQPQPYPPYSMDSQHGYSSDVWLAQDGQKLYKELSFPFVTNAATCQRLAKQSLVRSRTGNGIEDSLNKGLSFSVDCNLSAYDIVAHDTVWFNYPRFNWTAPPSSFSVPTADIPEYTYTEFEVVSTSFNIREQGPGKPPVPVYTLNLRATSPNIFLWNPADELPMTENKYPQFINTMQVAGPTSLTATSGSAHAIVNPDGTQSDGILAKWTAPADGYVLNGGDLVVQIMPVVTTAQTYTSTPVTGGGVDNTIALSGSTNPFAAAGSIFLAGAGVGGVDWTGTIASVSGQNCTLVQAPPTAVTNGAILGAGWQTVTRLDGATNQYLIGSLVDGEQYYVQVYAQNSAGRTSVPAIAGPVTATSGSSTPGLLPYPILPNPIRVAVDLNGYVQNLGASGGTTIGATGAGTLGLIDSSGTQIPNAVIPKQVVNTYPFAATNSATRPTGANDGDIVYFDQASGPSGCLYVVDQNQGVISGIDSPPLITLLPINPPSGLGSFVATNITPESFQISSKTTGSTVTYPSVAMTKASITYNPSYSPTVLTAFDASNTAVNQTAAGSFTTSVLVAVALSVNDTWPPLVSGSISFVAQVWSGNMGTLLASGPLTINWNSRQTSAQSSIQLPVNIAEGSAFTVRVYATSDTTGAGGVGLCEVSAVELTVSAGASSVNGVNFTGTIIEGW